MSHLSDEDDEYLYGASDTPKNDNPLLDTKNEVEDLYDLYDGEDAKDTDEKEEETVEEQATEKPAEDEKKDEDTAIPEADNIAEVTVAEEENEEEDDDSDDDLEIILEEDIQPETEAEPVQGEQAATTTEIKDTPVNIKPGQQGKPSSTPATNSTANASATGTKTSQGGINLELIGEYNGQPITDVDLDNVEDKPWRKPGADITDYFNYGFNEVSWRSYCAKQKMLRENKKMMGDMDMGDFMSMGMMMPPNMMDGGLPMAMAGMPNAAMLGLPMGMPPPPQAGGNDPAMRNNRMNARGTGRNMPMNRAKNADGKEGGNEIMNPMDGNMPPMDEGGMFPMNFPGGPGGMPMNMFPPDMPGGPMGMPFFNPNMPGVPIGFDGADFRGGGGNNSPSGRSPMRGGGGQHMGGGSSGGGGRSQSSRSGHNNNNSSSGGGGGGSGGQSSNWRGRDDSDDHRSSDSRKRQMNSGGGSSNNDRESSSNQDDHYNKRSRNR